MPMPQLFLPGPGPLIVPQIESFYGTHVPAIVGRLEFQSEVIVEQLLPGDDQQFFPTFG